MQLLESMNLNVQKSHCEKLVTGGRLLQPFFLTGSGCFGAHPDDLD
jgi:hypothetical protein